MEKGTQVIYIPDHADSDANHPDSKCGFVASEGRVAGAVFCRFWNEDFSALETTDNSERTPIANLILERSVDQARVDEMLILIDKGYL